VAYLIGLGGYAGSGKDTVADHLVNHHKYMKTFMSEPLDQGLKAINPLIPLGRNWWIGGLNLLDREAILRARRRTTELLEEDLTARYSILRDELSYDSCKKNAEVRRLLQAFGTDFGRDMVNKNIWVNICEDKLDHWLDEGFDCCFTGVRYRNELLMVMRQHGHGYTVWVERPDIGPVNSHSSDNSLHAKDFDFVLLNDGNIRQLYERVDILVSELSYRLGV
jgi:hypothetical protein